MKNKKSIHFYNITLFVLQITLLICSIIAAPLFATEKNSLTDAAWNKITPVRSFTIPATGNLEVAFSPNGGAEELVLKTINSATFEIRMLAYSFTSGPIVKALIQAKKRGVDVALVADDSNAKNKSKGRAALSALVNAGCDIRIISVYTIHHDKVIIVDRSTVELGSFNYSASAAHRNSENVLVNWNNPGLANIYLSHFARNQQQSIIYNTDY